MQMHFGKLGAMRTLGRSATLVSHETNRLVFLARSQASTTSRVRCDSGRDKSAGTTRVCRNWVVSRGEVLVSRGTSNILSRERINYNVVNGDKQLVYAAASCANRYRPLPDSAALSESTMLVRRFSLPGSWCPEPRVYWQR